MKSLSGPLFIMLLATCVLTAVVTYQLSLRQLGFEHKPFLENMLWQFDIQTIEYQLPGFVDLESVKRIVVTGSTGKFIKAEDSTNSASIPVVVVPLTHIVLNGNVEEIGTLSIHASDEGVCALARG